MTAVAVAAVVAGLLAVIDPIPYVRDIRRGRTRPQRTTWLIWSVLGVVGFTSQLADGATWSLAMVGMQTVAVLVVFALSLRFGVGGIAPTDIAAVAIAACGLAVWASTADPTTATIAIVVADIVAVGAMLPKTWRDPWSETLSSFALASLSGAFGAFAVGAFRPSLLLYPVYFAVACALTCVVIVHRRRALGNAYTVLAWSAS